MFLHGGWGYEIYPIDRQLAALSDYHIVIPDRTGYGSSGRLPRQESDFHSRAADETFGVIDALGLERPVLWGHSDGAVIALLMALDAPERLGGLILEAAHFYRDKPSSREFFEVMRDDPDKLGERVASVLAREHGESWRDVMRINGAAWLAIAAQKSAGADLYSGRLHGVALPVLVVHGGRDPRTEAGELDALRRALPGAAFAILPDGGHSPHSERATADDVTHLLRRFLADLASSREQHAAS
jgi:pimeloyl-ACP methyl ester carboxylesterase